MDRRSFLKNAGLLISMPAILGGEALTLWGSETDGLIAVPEGRILVLIQLDGGNDGLNTVIPVDQQDILSQLRPEIVIPADKVLKIDSKTGLHPAFQEIGRLYRDQKIMIIQNVGYPSPNLSHFRSKEIILSASASNQVVTSGWIGRYLNLVHPLYPDTYPSETHPHPLAITIGNMSSPVFQGKAADMGVTAQSLTSAYQAPTGTGEFPDTPYGFELKYISGVMEKTGSYLQEIQKAANAAQNLSTLYAASGNTLSDQLKMVARMICGGLKTPVYMLSLGGFDTHANQVITTAHETGNHANQLRKISVAVNAFLDDINLHQSGDKVIGMIYSEFGRRIRSNKSDGTDHGEAFPVIFFGNPVNPAIHGDNPELNITMEPKANLPWKTDFRSLYRSVLTDWLQVSETDAAGILSGNFEHVQILKSSVNKATELQNNYDQTVEIYPNPVTENALIRFYSPGGETLVQVVSLTGREIWVMSERSSQRGIKTVTFSSEGISAGTYFLVIGNQALKTTRKIIIR